MCVHVLLRRFFLSIDVVNYENESTVISEDIIVIYYAHNKTLGLNINFVVEG